MERILVFYYETEFKDSEIGRIPKDWKIVRMGDITYQINNRYKNYPNKDEICVYSIDRYKGLIPQNNKFKKKVASVDLSNYKVLSKGNLVYGFPINEGVIYVYTADKPVCVSPAYYVFEFKRIDVDFSFMDFLLKQPFMMRQYLRYATNTVERRKIIKPQDFFKINVPLPPLQEQKAIAEVLKSVQQAIEEAEEVIRATKEFKKSMMRHLFTYGYVATGEKDRVKVKQTEIGLIPATWEVVKLEDICIIKSGGTPSTEEKAYWEGGNIPWINSEKCQHSFIYDTDKFITELGLKKSSAKIFDKDTVLIAMVGATAGKTGYLMFPASTNQNVAGLYPADKSRLYPLYLFYSLQSRYNYFSRGKGYKIINLSFIKKSYIPLPPLEEQQAIAEVLQAIDNKIQKEENKKQTLENLFKSMLHHLMTGKIRIKT